MPFTGATETGTDESSAALYPERRLEDNPAWFLQRVRHFYSLLLYHITEALT